MEPKEDSFWMGIYIGKGSKKVTVEAQFDDTSPYNLIAQKWVKGMDIQSAKPGDDYDKAVPDALGQRYQVLGCVKLQYFQHTGAKSFHDYFYVVNERPPESADSLVGTGSGLWKSYRDSHVHDAHPVSLAKVTPGERERIRREQEKKVQEEQALKEEIKANRKSRRDGNSNASNHAASQPSDGSRA